MWLLHCRPLTRSTRNGRQCSSGPRWAGRRRPLSAARAGFRASPWSGRLRAGRHTPLLDVQIAPLAHRPRCAGNSKKPSHRAARSGVRTIGRTGSGGGNRASRIGRRAGRSSVEQGSDRHGSRTDTPRAVPLPPIVSRDRVGPRRAANREGRRGPRMIGVARTATTNAVRGGSIPGCTNRGTQPPCAVALRPRRGPYIQSYPDRGPECSGTGRWSGPR